MMEYRYSTSVARVDISKLKIPKEVRFGVGDFASYRVDYTYAPGPVFNPDEKIYQDRLISDTQEKLDFLYTALVDKYAEKDIRIFKGYIKYLEKVLIEAGCSKVEFENIAGLYNERLKPLRPLLHPEEIWYDIDTENMSDEYFRELIYNTRRLLSFLFSEKSVVKIQLEDEKLRERTDLGPEKSTDKVFYGWTWFC